jgi:hypothetical protein
MGADIENPDPAGCVAAEEPTQNTFKEKLVASFLGNHNGAGDGDGNEKTGKPPDGGADVAAAKPVQCQSGWRNRVLCLCSAIFFIVAVSFLLPQKRDEVDGIKNRQHILMACIGFPVGMVLSFSLFFAALVQN